MMPKNLTPEARSGWHRKNYERLKSDPARWAKELERKRRNNAARKARRAAKAKPLPRSINAEVYRAHGPFAPLFAMQRAA
jgi:hypothetical protein